MGFMSNFRKRATIAVAWLVTASWAGAQKFEIPDWESSVAFDLLSSQAAVRPGDRFEVALVATIDPGYHLYGPEEKKPSRTEVSPGGEAVSFGDASFPPSTQRELEGLGTYYLYEGKVAIRIPTTVEKDAPVGEEIPISVKVNYQVCTDFACSAPTSKLLSLTLPVVPAGSKVERTHQDLFSTKIS